MSNDLTDYVDNFRANLPAGITFNSTTNRYYANDKPFANEWDVVRYIDYIVEFGFVTSGATSAYSANGLEPPLVLDFNETFYRTSGTATDLVSAATHTRASSATYVDADGILQTAAINEPRVGHHIWNGSAWVDEGYLHESEARTNLETQSVSLADYTANESNGVVTSGESDPWGGTSGGILTASGTAAYSFGSVLNDNGPLTFSVFLRQGMSSAARLQIGENSAISGVYADVDLANGTIGPATSKGVAYTPVTSTIENWGNGWYRASVTANFTVRIHVGYLTFPTSTSGDSYYFAAPQLEAGSTPSSYIPTSGSTFTRAADTLTIPSANLPWPTEAPLAVSIKMEGTMTGQSRTFAKWTLDANNEILLQSGASDFTFTQEAGGVVDTVTGGSYTSGINVPFSSGSRHGSTFLNGAVDGTALTANTTPTALPDLSATNIQIGSDFMGTIKLFRVWADDIADAGIAEETVGFGTAPAIADGQQWLTNATTVSLDGSASGGGLTFTYAMTGAPAGVVINSSTGAITGTPTADASGTATITSTDQFGRTVTTTFTYSVTQPDMAILFSNDEPGFIFDASDTSSVRNWTGDAAIEGAEVLYLMDLSRGSNTNTELRDIGTTGVRGSPSVAAEYNTTTGVGLSRRDSSSNISGVAFNITEGKRYIVKGEVLTGVFQIRSGVGTFAGTHLFQSTVGTFEAHVSVTGSLYNLYLASGADAATTTFRIDSIQEAHAANMYFANPPTYRENGGKPYLEFNGVNDSGVTPVLPFAGNDVLLMAVAAAKQSSDTRLLMELSEDSNNNDGTGWLISDVGWAATARGTSASRSSHSANTPASPIATDSSVIAESSIAGDFTTVEVNGVALATSSGDKGGGSLTSHEIYIGSRGGSSLFFEGRLYAAVARASNTVMDAEQVAILRNFLDTRLPE